nr:Clavata3/esr-related 14, putative [Ipomoea batatas]
MRTHRHRVPVLLLLILFTLHHAIHSRLINPGIAEAEAEAKAKPLVMKNAVSFPPRHLCADSRLEEVAGSISSSKADPSDSVSDKISSFVSCSRSDQKTMKLQKTCLVSFMVTIIIVSSLVRESSCLETAEKEEEARIRSKFFSTFFRYFHTIPRVPERKEIRRVSRRLVPCGPNPLHN